MAGNEVDKPSGYPDSWPGVAALVLRLATESWVKLVQVCIVLVLAGGVVFLVASHVHR
jgi:hypothetical protein